MEGLASIEGKVTDQQGEGLPGAVVIFTPQEAAPRETVTRANGSYHLSDIPIGRGTLEAEMTGFKTYVKYNIEIRQGQNQMPTIVLQVASIEENI